MPQRPMNDAEKLLILPELRIRARLRLALSECDDRIDRLAGAIGSAGCTFHPDERAVTAPETEEDAAQRAKDVEQALDAIKPDPETE